MTLEKVTGDHKDVSERDIPNIKATYRGPAQDGITGQIWPARYSTKLDKPDAAHGVTTTTVGGHPAILDTGLPKMVILTWRSGPWDFTVYVRAPSGGKMAAARAMAPRFAKEAAAWADRLLVGENFLSAGERNAHLASLETALAQAKAQTEREAVAQSARDQKTQEKDLKRQVAKFIGVLEHSGVESVESVRISEFSTNVLEITVRPEWFYEPKQAKQEAATVLWQLWATIHSPRDLDHARIRLKTQSGDDLGGSGIAGSSISVD